MLVKVLSGRFPDADNEGGARSWLLQITRNRAVDLYRRIKKERPLDTVSPAAATGADTDLGDKLDDEAAVPADPFGATGDGLDAGDDLDADEFEARMAVLHREILVPSEAAFTRESAKVSYRRHVECMIACNAHGAKLETLLREEVGADISDDAMKRLLGARYKAHERSRARLTEWLTESAQSGTLAPDRARWAAHFLLHLGLLDNDSTKAARAAKPRELSGRKAANVNAGGEGGTQS